MFILQFLLRPFLIDSIFRLLTIYFCKQNQASRVSSNEKRSFNCWDKPSIKYCPVYTTNRKNTKLLKLTIVVKSRLYICVYISSYSFQRTVPKSFIFSLDYILVNFVYCLRTYFCTLIKFDL